MNIWNLSQSLVYNHQFKDKVMKVFKMFWLRGAMMRKHNIWHVWPKYEHFWLTHQSLVVKTSYLKHYIIAFLGLFLFIGLIGLIIASSSIHVLIKNTMFSCLWNIISTFLSSIIWQYYSHWWTIKHFKLIYWTNYSSFL